MPTNLSLATIDKVAHLSLLSLTTEERELFSKQLNKILSFIEELNEVDTTQVPPTSHVMELTNVWREDEVEPSLSQEEALRSAATTQDGYFVVPAVMTGRGRKNGS